MGVWSLVLWNMWSRAVQLHCQKAERQGGARDRIPASDLLSPARPHMLEKVPQAVPPSGDQEFHTRACGEQHFTFGSSSLAPGPRIWHQRLLCCAGMRFWAQSKPVPRAEASRLEVLSVFSSASVWLPTPVPPDVTCRARAAGISVLSFHKRLL